MTSTIAHGASAAQSHHDLLQKTADPVAFRAAVRAWLEDVTEREKNAFPKLDGSNYYQHQQWWMAERNKVGMATPHWPVEYGGADLSLANQVIVVEARARGGAPQMTLFTVSLTHVPATLIEWGTREQRAFYLPKISTGVVWCQGFSEPNAGSDLAALKTQATRAGDHYVINGQKIWSSYSMYAEHCILLARTDPSAPKHAGISYFLMDMKTPGVEVRPLRQTNGTAKFAEIFLTDVRIPLANLVGPENAGWRVAQSTLAAERGVLAFEAGERLRHLMERFFARALQSEAEWLRDPAMTREFARLFGEMQGSRRLLRRLLKENEQRSPRAAETVVYVKLINTSLKRKVGDFMVRAGALPEQLYAAAPDEDPDQPMNTFLTSFAGTIAGGSNEIMRNMLAERILGMPRS